VSVELVEAACGALSRIAASLESDAVGAFATGRSLLAAHWDGLAAIEAGEVLREQCQLVALASEAIGDAVVALGPVVAALRASQAAVAAAERAAEALGVSLETDAGAVVVSAGVAPGAADPGLAAAGIGAIRDALAAVRHEVDAADIACAGRLNALVAVAQSMVVFPIRPAAVTGMDAFTAPVAPEPGLLGSGPLLSALARAPVVPAVAATAPGQAVLAPTLVAADLAEPALARELAGRISLFVSLAGGAAKTAVAAGTLLVPAADGAPRRVLEWDPAHGHLAEVAGDLATADRVIVFVPGTSTSLSGWAEIAGAITQLYDALRADASDDRVAVIGWYGAAAPPNLAAAALQSYAKDAAPALATFVRGLELAPAARVTLVGHSYGAVVAGLAVHEGLRPQALVGVGAPGFGPHVDDVGDLGGVPTFVLTHPGDPISDVPLIQRTFTTLLGAPLGPLGEYAADRLSGAAGIGHLGVDPTRLPGATRLSTGDDHAHHPLVATNAALHDDYFEPGSPSLLQIARVASGEPPVPYDR
jgi:hypothetical protein